MFAFVATMPWFDDPPLLVWPDDLPAYAVFMGGCLLSALLVARQRVHIDDQTVVVQNALIRRRLATADIASVEAVNYSGLLNGSSRSRFLHALQITMTDGREITAYGVIGRRSTVDDRARALRLVLGLTLRPGPRRY